MSERVLSSLAADGFADNGDGNIKVPYASETGI